MEIFVLLLLTMAIPFPMCYFRMNKYDVSLPKMLLIYVVFSSVGFIGALYGPPLVGITRSGIRLYGLVLFDFIALFVMSKVLRMDVRKLGDFITPSIMAVCSSSKINCLIRDCCKGIVLFNNSDIPVRFPSVIVEMAIWAIFVAALLIIDRKKRSDGYMWPILMIWFGIVRFLADFLRGSELERRPYLIGLTGGQFWSLVSALAGMAFLIWTFRKNWNRFPTIAEALRIAVSGSILASD